MKRRIMFIVIPIILVLALLASPVLAKDPESPGKGLLWEAIEGLKTGLATLAEQVNEGLESLQEQIDGIQAYLANFTEEDPVFSAMDTEAELEAQIGGQNILTQWEDISLLYNDARYITEGSVVCLNYKDTVTIAASLPGVYDSSEHLTWVPPFDKGQIILSAGGHVTYMWEGKREELDPYYYGVFTGIDYDTDSPVIEYSIGITNPFTFEKTFTFELYCVYID